jgi:hypothetical protein
MQLGFNPHRYSRSQFVVTNATRIERWIHTERANLGIAMCVPKIHSAKQRMWRATATTILLVPFGACLSQKSASAFPYLLTVHDMDFSSLSAWTCIKL